MSEKLHHWTLLQRNKNIFPQKNCAEVSTVALSIIAENWRQPRYSSMAEWFNILQYIHSYHGILVSDQREQTIDACTTCVDPKELERMKKKKRQTFLKGTYTVISFR